LSVEQIFGVENLCTRRVGCSQNQCVPERDLKSRFEIECLEAAQLVFSPILDGGAAEATSTCS